MKLHDQGFSLLEALFALTVASVLVIWAVPGYRAYARRVHRAEAERRLLQLALNEERYHAVHQAYGKAEALGEKLGSDGFYRYGIEIQEQGFRATAIPIGAQARDACGSLSLDQAGAWGRAGELRDAACR